MERDWYKEYRDKTISMAEATVLKAALKSSGAPEAVQNFFYCLAKNGCRIEAIAKGVVEFSAMQTKVDQKELHELLKDLPFKVELEGEDNE